MYIYIYCCFWIWKNARCTTYSESKSKLLYICVCLNSKKEIISRTRGEVVFPPTIEVEELLVSVTEEGRYQSYIYISWRILISSMISSSTTHGDVTVVVVLFRDLWMIPFRICVFDRIINEHSNTIFLSQFYIYFISDFYNFMELNDLFIDYKYQIWLVSIHLHFTRTRKLYDIYVWRKKIGKKTTYFEISYLNPGYKVFLSQALKF